MVPFFIGMTYKFYIVTRTDGAIWSGSRYRHWSKAGNPVTYRSMSGLKQGLRSYRMQRTYGQPVALSDVQVLELRHDGQTVYSAVQVLKACKTCGHVPA